MVCVNVSTTLGVPTANSVSHSIMTSPGSTEPRATPSPVNYVTAMATPPPVTMIRPLTPFPTAMTLGEGACVTTVWTIQASIL